MQKILLTIIAVFTLSSTVNAQTSAFSVQKPETFANEPLLIPSGFVQIPTPVSSNLRITGDWTLEAWVKLTSSSRHSIIETYSTTGNNGGFILRISGNKVRAYQILNQANNLNSVIGRTTLINDKWYHIAATLNEADKQLKVYVNGKLDGTTNTTLSTYNNNTALYIGARGDDKNVGGNMLLDNVKIWSKTKTIDEIIADTLACLTGNEEDLLAWYDFEDLTTSTLTDKSSNGNNGSFIGMQNIVQRIYTCKSIITTIPLTSASNNEDGIENIMIYPNPTTSQITLNTTEEIDFVSILDIAGKDISKINIPNKKVDISNLGAGTYFLQIHTKKGIFTRRFIKE